MTPTQYSGNFYFTKFIFFNKAAFARIQTQRHKAISVSRKHPQTTDLITKALDLFCSFVYFDKLHDTEFDKKQNI